MGEPPGKHGLTGVDKAHGKAQVLLGLVVNTQEFTK
jgi:hypothetical protein